MDKEKIGKYVSVAFAIYTLFLFILVIVGIGAFWYGFEDRIVANDILSYINPILVWFGTPYLLFLIACTLFYIALWFIVEPLRELRREK